MSGPVFSTLWIVSPVYLDVQSFLALRQKITEIMSSRVPLRFKDIRFVAIDDTAGSDPDFKQVTALSDCIVITPHYNLGHQAALVHALRSLTDEIADDDYVITLDSDGEDRPEDVPRLLEELAKCSDSRKALALAWRTKRRESLTFKTLYFMFKIMFKTLTGFVIRTGNFAAYRGWFVRNMIHHPHFDLCYSSSLIGLGLSARFVPCERGTRYFGESRMNTPKLIAHGLQMLMPFLDKIAVRALMIFFGTFAAGIAGCGTILVVKLFTQLAIPGWATYSALLTLLLSFSALGNFLVLFAIYSQSQRRASPQTHQGAANQLGKRSA